MAGRVRRMLVGIVPAVLDGPGTALLRIRDLDDEVDALHSQIVKFLGQVSQRTLSDRNTAELVALIEATNNIEAIGDIIETNMVQIGFQRIDQSITPSESSRRVLTDLHVSVVAAYDTAMDARTGVLNAMDLGTISPRTICK